MLELKEGMLLYHGSYTEVSKIDLSKCIAGKDFGKGFYTTSSIEQAKNFIHLTVNRAINRKIIPSDTDFGYISTFRCKNINLLKIKKFDEANREWLHYIAANRDPELFQALIIEYEKYNAIIGKIANDRTAATLQLYLSGAYGEPGSESADAMAISTLLPNKLENQVCFKDETAISTLEFIKSEKYGIR